MLIHRHDEPLSDAEWREFLKTHDFGDFIVPGAPTRDLPVVVPTHFIWDGDKTVLLHLARANPVWEAIAERPRGRRNCCKSAERFDKSRRFNNITRDGARHSRIHVARASCR